MTITAEQAEKYAEELVKLSIEQRQIKERINGIKGELLEFTDVENMSDKVWQVDNGLIEVHLETKYKLAEVPATIEIDPNVVAIDTAEKAFKSKVTLSKEGKRMFEEGDATIRKLMIANDKKVLKITI